MTDLASVLAYSGGEARTDAPVLLLRTEFCRLFTLRRGVTISIISHKIMEITMR